MSINEFLLLPVAWLPLVDAAAKASLLIAAAGLITAALRRASAASRQTVGGIWAVAGGHPL